MCSQIFTFQQRRDQRSAQVLRGSTFLVCLNDTSTAPLFSQDKHFARAVSNLPPELREPPDNAGMDDAGLLRGYPRTPFSQLGIQLVECTTDTDAKLYRSSPVCTSVQFQSSQSSCRPHPFRLDRVSHTHRRQRYESRYRNPLLACCSGRGRSRPGSWPHWCLLV